MRKSLILLLILMFSGHKMHAYNNIQLPAIPSSNEYNVTSYGASTGSLDNTISIQNAINACAIAGGGIVIVPSGTFLCGPLVMKNNVDLRISEGATLKLLPYGTYPNTGVAEKYDPLIKGYENTNIRVSGGGTIDAQGAEWWTAYENSGRTIGRPAVISINYSNKSQIDGIKIINAPNVHIAIGRGCTNSTISNVTILTPDGTPNTDGIDTWSPFIDILNCNISCGDDNIAMNVPSSYVTVKHCTFGTGHGCSIGSYASNITHILVDSCTFEGTDNGARLKASRNRGGVEEYITYSNCTMNNVSTPFSISSYYPNTPAYPEDDIAFPIFATTPTWRHVTFQNIVVTNADYAGMFWGLPEMSISDVVFDNVQIEAAVAMKAYFVDGLQFINGSSISVPNYGRIRSKVIDTYGTTTSGLDTRTGQLTSGSGAIPLPETILVSPAGAASGNTQPYSLTYAMTLAEEGDILLLDAGTYNTDITFPSARSVNVRMNPDAASKPVFTSSILTPSGDGGSLSFNGIKFNRNNNNYLFDIGADKDLGSLVFENCEISGISKSLINTPVSNAGAIRSIVLENCSINNCGTSKTNFIHISSVLDTMILANSTLNNYKGGDFLNVHQDSLAQTIHVNFTNNTIYKSIINNGYALCSLGGGFFQSGEYIFNNNILDGAAAAVSPRLMYTKGGGGKVSQNNNLKVGWQDDYISGSYSTTRNNLSLDAGILAGVTTVPYVSAGTGDFSIPGTSPIASAGLNGAYLGDPEWILPESNSPVLSTTQPVSGGTNVPTSGKIILQFDEKIVKTATFKASLNGQDLTGEVTGKSVVLQYSGLQYNTQYTFSMDANSIADIYGNAYASAYNLSFTTLNHAKVTKKLFDFVVGVDGDFKAALAAAEAAGGERFRIFFPNGDYNIGVNTGDANQKTVISLPNVSYIGQDADSVVLYNKNTSEGMGVTATIEFSSTANNLYLQDISIKNGDYRNGSASLGRCVALFDLGDRNIFKNVNVLSNQDTYFSGTGRKYFEDGSIHGTVDYIFGGGDVFFNRSLLYMEGSGYVTAANTTTDTPWGYVFRDCTIDGVPTVNGNYRLGRPWQNSPKVVFINTAMNKIPVAEGWGGWYTLPDTYAEYNSVNEYGYPIDLSQRKTVYTSDLTSVTLDPVLAKDEADAYTINNVLGGNDAWQPELYTDQARIPQISAAGRVINWEEDDYVLCWAVFRNNEFQCFTTSNNYLIPGDVVSGTYTVRAANEMGGLSSVSNLYEYNSSSHIPQAGDYVALVSGNFNDITKWGVSGNGGWVSTGIASHIPTETDNLWIPSGVQMVNSAALSVGNLTLRGECTLNASLTVKGDLKIISELNKTASLLGNQFLTVTGTISEEQFLPVARNWYIASPMSNTSVTDGVSVFSYDETGSNSGYTAPATSYWVSQDAGSIYEKGVGYVIKPVNANVLKFTGTLNDGNVSLTLTNRGALKAGFNLVGNPYPSFLNARSAVGANSNLQSSIWYRTRSAGDVPSYYFETVNTSSGVGTNNAGTGIVTGLVPPMQAFWVKANVDNEILAFNNTMRTHSGIDAGEPSTSIKSPQSLANKVLRLKVSNGTNSDEVILVFHPEALNTFDIFDSEKISNDNPIIPEIYSIETGSRMKLAINGLQDPESIKEISLGFKAGNSNDFTLKATEISNFVAGTQIVLKDLLDGSETVLSNSKEYQFSSDEYVDSDRFRIIFNTPGTITSQQEYKIDDDILLEVEGLQIRILSGLIGAKVNVYNILGVKITEKYINSTETKVSVLESGIYLIKVLFAGEEKTFKVHLI